MTSKLNELSIHEASQLLKEKKISAVELTEACLKQIEAADDKVKAFVSVADNEALAAAKESDQRFAGNKPRSPLEGIPLALKDNLSTQGIKTTASSKILENYLPPFDATVVSKIKEAGAVILGKTNLDEFAMGSSTETSYFGPSHNPWDLKRVPGGSSGGSAAAVGAQMSLGALGSDTGGSIRQPAAFCGIVGLKPTYGAVSRYGLLAMASSLDQIGPMTKTVDDAEMVFQMIAGKDPMDSTSSKYQYQSSSTDNPEKLKGLKIGVAKEYFGEGLDRAVEKVVKDAIQKLQNAGAEIIDISLPHTKYALATYYIIMPAEVSSNLARYDGIKYGLKEEGNNLLAVYLKTRAKGFGDEAKRRIMLGTYVLSAGYYEAFYKKAQQVRTLVKEDFDKAWEQVDVIATPVTPTLPFLIGEKAADPLAMYLSDVLTVPMNIVGLPAISVPCGITQDLPVGLQIIGKDFDERQLIEVARAFEQLRGIMDLPTIGV